MHVQPYVLTSKRSECAGQARPTLVFGPRRPKHYHHVQTARARPKLVIGQFDACTSLPGTATADKRRNQSFYICETIPRPTPTGEALRMLRPTQKIKGRFTTVLRRAAHCHRQLARLRR